MTSAGPSRSPRHPAGRRTPTSVRGPGELVAAIPVLLGFHPERSLVVVSTHGPGLRTVGVTLRADLPDPTAPDDVGELCEMVAAVHPDLQFALERGQRAIYALVVTGQEDPDLRPYTDAWRAAAPPDDVVWEYHDSVPPVPDPSEVTVNLAGHSIRLADMRVVAQVDEAAGVVDVAVYHPLLGELAEMERQTMTFLPLDATLGERVAGERLRRVETAVAEPENTITLLEFRELVGRLGTADAENDTGTDTGTDTEPHTDPTPDADAETEPGTE